MSLRKGVLTILVAFLALVNVTYAAKRSKEEKYISKKWKMWKEEKGGAETEPTVSQIILEIKKNKSFVIVKGYENTHRGTWKLEGKTTLILDDYVTNTTMTLPIKELDATHLVLDNLDQEGITTYMTPLKNKNAIHLTHKEHLVAKRWRIYESTKEKNVGSLFELHEDKTLSYIPSGTSVPLDIGSWDLSDNAKQVTFILSKSNKEIILDVIELHRHEMILKNHETGIEDKYHDELLTQRDLDSEEGVKK